MNKRTKTAHTKPAAAEKSSPIHWARFWGVSRDTIFRWIKTAVAGRMPRIDDVPGILKWELTNPSRSAKFAARCKELRAEIGIESEKPQPDAAWVEFRKAGDAPKGHGEQIKTLEMFRDGYAMKLDAAMTLGDMPAVRQWNELLIITTTAIRQSKLAAEKMGHDEGQTFSFEELDRIIFALGYWLLRSVDLQLDTLASRLAKMPANSDAKAYRAVLEPVLISEAWVTPWAKASKPTGVSLPARVVAKFRTVCGDFIERGEAVYLEEVAKHETKS